MSLVCACVIIVCVCGGGDGVGEAGPIWGGEKEKGGGGRWFVLVPIVFRCVSNISMRMQTDAVAPNYSALSENVFLNIGMCVMNIFVGFCPMNINLLFSI